MTNKPADSLEDIIAKFASYCACDEYHYSTHDGSPGNHDPNDGHVEFDEEQALAAIEAHKLAWLESILPKRAKGRRPVMSSDRYGYTEIREQTGYNFGRSDGFNAAIDQIRSNAREEK